MRAFSPEQTLVLAAIERFMADPDLVATDDASEEGDVMDVILHALAMVLPYQQIELAIAGLLVTPSDEVDEDTQVVLEGLLAIMERIDHEESSSLEEALDRHAGLIEANALEGNLLLVWDPSLNPPLQEVTILELLDRYPCLGDGACWPPEDFVRFLGRKREEWLNTMLAVRNLQEGPAAIQAASTVILLVPEDDDAALEALTVAANLTPAPEGNSLNAWTRPLAEKS